MQLNKWAWIAIVLGALVLFNTIAVIVLGDPWAGCNEPDPTVTVDGAGSGDAPYIPTAPTPPGCYTGAVVVGDTDGFWIQPWRPQGWLFFIEPVDAQCVHVELDLEHRGNVLARDWCERTGLGVLSMERATLRVSGGVGRYQFSWE